MIMIPINDILTSNVDVDAYDTAVIAVWTAITAQNVSANPALMNFQPVDQSWLLFLNQMADYAKINNIGE